MQDKTIDNALLALRKQIIRGKLDGLDHVEALLWSRGIDPALHIVRPQKRPDRARRGMMRLIVIDALRDGPKNMPGLAAIVAAKRPEISPEAAYQRAAQVLVKLKIDGIVKREGRLWGLAQ